MLKRWVTKAYLRLIDLHRKGNHFVAKNSSSLNIFILFYYAFVPWQSWERYGGKSTKNFQKCKLLGGPKEHKYYWDHWLNEFMWAKIRGHVISCFVTLILVWYFWGLDLIRVLFGISGVSFRLARLPLAKFETKQHKG